MFGWNNSHGREEFCKLFGCLHFFSFANDFEISILTSLRVFYVFSGCWYLNKHLISIQMFIKLFLYFEKVLNQTLLTRILKHKTVILPAKLPKVHYSDFRRASCMHGVLNHRCIDRLFKSSFQQRGHQICALPAICVGSPPVSGGFRTKCQ